MSQIQASPFGPLHFYDAPEVAVTQLLDGEATFGSFVDTFFSPDELSPFQRDQYSDRLKQHMGIEEKSVGSAMIDIATNPLSYLALLFAPAGARVAGRLFSNNVKNNLSFLFARNGHEMMMGTPGTPAINRMIQRAKELTAESENLLGPAELRYAESMGIERAQYLDPRKIKDDLLRKQVEEDKLLILYRNSGMDSEQVKTVTEYFPTFEEVISPGMMGPPQRINSGDALREIGEAYKAAGVQTDLFEHAGKIYRVDNSSQAINIVDVQRTQGALIDFSARGGIDAVLRERGLLDLAESYQDVFRQRMVRNFMKEGTSIDDIKRIEKMGTAAEREAASMAILDENKVLRLKNAMKDSQFTDESLGLPGFYDRILSRNVRADLMSGKKLTIKDTDFRNMIVKGMANDLFNGGKYHPRNVVEFYHHQTKPGMIEEFVEVTGMMRPTFDKAGRLDARNVQAAMFAASGRSMRRMATSGVYHADDLFALRDIAAKNGGQVGSAFNDHMQLYANVKAAARNSAKAEGRVVPIRRMDLSRSVASYENQTMRDHVLYVDELTDLERAAQREALFDDAGNLRYRDSDVLARARDLKEGAPAPRLMQVFDGAGGTPPGGWTRADLLEQTGQMLRTVAQDTAGVREAVGELRGEKAAELLKEVVLPAALGVRTNERALTRGALTYAQGVAEKMAHSKFGDMLGGVHPSMRNAVDQLKYFSERNVGELMDPVTNRMAGYLYSSHLGLNMASVVLNLQQPFLHLNGIVGTRATLAGMRDATEELMRYGRERAKLPVNISNVERKELIDRVLQFPDETGLMGDVLTDLDRMMDTARMNSSKFDIDKFLIEYPMKGFEKAEWMNRITTVHAVKHNYLSRGLASVDDGVLRFKDDITEQMFRADAKQAVTQFQFGADVLGTPMVFMPGTSKVLTNVPAFLENPLFRQFQSFGLRSLTSLFLGGAGVARGQRFLRGTDIEVPYVVGDTLRMLGTSAIIYEGFKGAFGADVSRGGTIETLSAFADPEKIASGEFPFVIPPVLSISSDAIRGLLGGEAQLIGDAFARTVPGGIALQRALQVAPNTQEGFLKAISPAQKFYADYGQMNPDGLVPIKKSDGTLVDMQSPTQLVSRALGLNLSLPQYSRDIDGYMVRQRDKMNSYRRKWIDAVIRKGDIAEGERINQEFMKAYKFRLPVTKQQITAAIKGMETPRSLRMMDRMAPEIRAYFQQEMARNPERVQSTEDALLRIPTTADRRDALGTQTPVELSPEVLQELRRSMAETEQQRQLIEEGRFQPYTGF